MADNIVNCETFLSMFRNNEDVRSITLTQNGTWSCNPYKKEEK